MVSNEAPSLQYCTEASLSQRYMTKVMASIVSKKHVIEHELSRSSLAAPRWGDRVMRKQRVSIATRSAPISYSVADDSVTRPEDAPKVGPCVGEGLRGLQGKSSLAHLPNLHRRDD